MVMYKYIVESFWKDIDSKQWRKLQDYFHEEAVIDWINTNERFTPLEFISANCHYPLNWKVSIQKLEQIEKKVISLVYVKAEDSGNIPSFYATSFFYFEQDKIKLLIENWGENGEAPGWRKKMNIGGPIKKE